MVNHLNYTHQIITFSTLVCLAIPATVSGDCTSHVKANEGDKHEALKFKVIAITSVLTAGAIGVSFPIIGRKLQVLRPEHDMFFMIKAFAAGVILATGFIHILPDAFHALTSSCLANDPWREFPFAGFIAMAASIGTLIVDTVATTLYKNLHSNKAKLASDNSLEEASDGQENNGHLHGHPHGPQESHVPDLLRQRIISQVLEVGILVHSVFIGISLGASTNPNTIKPLLVALSFHQFFEGMGLGGCISQAKFKGLTTTTMILFFSLTTPIGIGIGMGISNVYKENSTRALIVQGVMNSASSGILIYMALVDILAADFMSPRMESNVRLQLGAHATLVLGAGCISFLAKWA